jgi:hypothetical protein
MPSFICARRRHNTSRFQLPTNSLTQTSKMFSQREMIELAEAADLSAPISSSVVPRWQRKALQASAAAGTPSKSPKKSSSKTPVAKKTPVVSS